MRIAPTLIKILQKLLFLESKRTDKPVVFLFHPNECLDVGTEVITTRRAKNTLEYVFADLLRQRMKLKNLGMAALRLLDNLLKHAKNQGFNFISISEYRKSYRDLHVGDI